MQNSLRKNEDLLTRKTSQGSDRGTTKNVKPAIERAPPRGVEPDLQCEGSTRQTGLAMGVQRFTGRAGRPP